MDIPPIGLSHTYREFLSDLRLAQCTVCTSAHHHAAEAATRNSDPVVVISSGSEGDVPPSKRRKASPPQEEPSPEVIAVTDEEAMSVEVGDLQYLEGADEDVSMPSPDPPIGVDPCNYDQHPRSVFPRVPSVSHGGPFSLLLYGLR
jgi:hypothetical protein